MLTRRRFVTASAMAAASATSGFAPRLFAQSLQKPARIAVGFPPGGSSDVVARLIAERMRGAYAPAVIVDNRPGAGGRIVLDYLKQAETDGSVMVQTPASMVVIYPHIYRKLSYDALADFAPVTTVCSFVFAVSVGPAVPDSVKTLAELMQWMKANPKQASYGSPAAGSVPHFTGLLIGRAAGVDLTHVAFKGGAPAIQDLIGGQIPMSINVLGEALQHHKAGKLRILATTGPTRSSYLAEVPTLREAGFDREATEWFGLFVPAKTPADTVGKLNAAVRQALKSREVTDGFAKFAFEPVGDSPAEFARRVRSEYDLWGPVVKSTGFKAEE
jgi:tripartite-type tricarboxylate transporter receptor subunit TctC